MQTLLISFQRAARRILAIELKNFPLVLLSQHEHNIFGQPTKYDFFIFLRGKNANECNQTQTTGKILSSNEAFSLSYYDTLFITRSAYT